MRTPAPLPGTGLRTALRATPPIERPANLPVLLAQDQCRFQQGATGRIEEGDNGSALVRRLGCSVR